MSDFGSILDGELLCRGPSVVPLAGSPTCGRLPAGSTIPPGSQNSRTAGGSDDEFQSFYTTRLQPRDVSQSAWWYGILLFPIVVLMTLISDFASNAFFLTTRSPDTTTGLTVIWLILEALSFWIGLLVAVVVLVCVLGDLWAVNTDSARLLSLLWGVSGVVHLGGILFTELFLVSVPALSYYVYQRRTGGELPRLHTPA